MCHVELSYCILLGKTRREWLGSAGFFSLKRDEKQSLIITCPVVTVLWEQEGWALCFFGEAHEAVQWQKHMQLPERMQVLQKGDWFPSVVVTLHLLHAGVNDNTRQRHTTCNHRPYCTLFGQDSSQRNFPFFCQHELASQIFILALKSLTSGPTEKLPFFFIHAFPASYAELHNRGDIVKSCHRNGEGKQKWLQRKRTDTTRGTRGRKILPHILQSRMSDPKPQKIQTA